MEIEEKMKTSDSKCEKCGGVGVITHFIDGTLFAKNCECTQKAILATKIKFANIPEEFKNIKVTDFKATLYKKDDSIYLAKNAREIVRNYMINFDELKKLGKGLYFYSKTKGSGKTMLAIALGNALINMRGEVVKFATTIDILTEIKSTYGDITKNESELINNLKKVEVLILDDIGTEKLTGWSNEIMYQIINYRMISKLITIFTSNTHISQLKHDERITNRIEKMAIPIQMPEESIRKQLAENENCELVKKLLGM